MDTPLRMLERFAAWLDEHGGEAAHREKVRRIYLGEES